MKSNLSKFLILFSFVSSIYPSEKITFQDAYDLEKESSLFAIPIYEIVLSKAATPKLKKATASRLFFLYKKHNKMIEAIMLGGKFSTLIAQKERSEIWSRLSKIYSQVTIEELTEAYKLAMQVTPETAIDLRKYLIEKNKSQLSEFVSLVLYKRKQWESARILLESDVDLIDSPLYKGMVIVKSQPEEIKSYLENQLRREMSSVSIKSDLSFLLGHYYRLRNDYSISARFFRMSASYKFSERGKMEAGRSLVLGEEWEEACRILSYNPESNDEVTVTLAHLCKDKDHSFFKKAYIGLLILSKREGGEFYEKILSRVSL